MAFAGGIAMAQDVVATAGDMMAEGNYKEALVFLQTAIQSDSQSSSIGQMNQLAGECALKLGDYGEAESYFKAAASKGVADASLELGRLAVLNYRFGEAKNLYGKYKSLKTKAKKPLSEEYSLLVAQNEMAEEMLEGTDDVVILDSLRVPQKDFFRSYRLPSSAGRLLDLNSIKKDGIVNEDAIAPVFSNEWGDRLIFSAPDTTGYLTLWESDKLADGSWNIQRLEGLAKDADLAFPFMLSDGQTLYFAQKGEESMGGYDIMVSSYNTGDGTFRTPRNIGMPYNSPSDDIMMAYDEENGIGWWATDRDLNPDGELCIYVFIPNESRNNLAEKEDEEGLGENDLLNRARITSLRQSWKEGEDYADKFEALKNIRPAVAKARAEFHFRMPDGQEITRYSQLRSQEGKEGVREYLRLRKELQQKQKRLESLRLKYHEGARGRIITDEIMELENGIPKLKNEIKETVNLIIQNES